MTAPLLPFADPIDAAISVGFQFPLFPRQASTFAARVDLLYFALVGFSAALTLLICFLLVRFAIRYRAGSKADRSNPIRRTLPYELSWIAALFLIGCGMFLWASQTFYEMTQPPLDSHSIYVVGKQWMWKVQHPEGQREINELHVPLGEPVKVILNSQDVIHSFYVPAFRVKQDVLPDRYTTVWFVPTEVGRFHLYCAEYCGAGHSLMRGSVVVLRPVDFEEWLTSAPEAETPVPGTPGAPDAPLALGGRGVFFQFGCNACHLPDKAVRAPRLDGLYGVEVRLRNNTTILADEQYLRESILYPNARLVAGYPAPSLMPTYAGQLTEEQLRQLIEFIKEIRYGWPEELLPRR